MSRNRRGRRRFGPPNSNTQGNPGQPPEGKQPRESHQLRSSGSQGSRQASAGPHNGQRQPRSRGQIRYQAGPRSALGGPQTQPQTEWPEPPPLPKGTTYVEWPDPEPPIPRPLPGPQRTILAWMPDMFFGSKLQVVAKHLGIGLEFLRDPGSLEERLRELQPHLFIVDLSTEKSIWDHLIRKARQEAPWCPIIGVGSHRDLQSRQGALDAGANEFVPNSRFFPHMPKVLSQYLAEKGAARASEPDAG